MSAACAYPDPHGDPDDYIFSFLDEEDDPKEDDDFPTICTCHDDCPPDCDGSKCECELCFLTYEVDWE